MVGSGQKVGQMSAVKRFLAISVALCSSLLFLTACNGNQQELEQLQAELDALQTSYEELQSEHEALQSEKDALEAKVEEAAPWFALSELEKEAEEERLAAELAAKEEAARLAAEQAAAEAEAKEKLGYNTGITYSQLSRTPDDYEGEKVKFSGSVVQVIEGSGETQLRVATSGKYDNIVFVYYPSDLVSSRVLEGDHITLYGISKGLFTYKSTGSGDITIPLIAVDKIDQ